MVAMKEEGTKEKKIRESEGEGKGWERGDGWEVRKRIGARRGERVDSRRWKNRLVKRKRIDERS